MLRALIALKSEGFAVGLIARSEDTLTPIQQEIEQQGGVAASIAADAANPASVATDAAQVKEKLGSPEVLVYNAGAFLMRGILELTPQQFAIRLEN